MEQVQQASETFEGGEEVDVNRARISELEALEVHSPAELYSSEN